MSIHGYQGNVISGTPPSVSPTSASGVWTLDDQLQNAANWPSQSNIARSLRFNSADSAYLSRSPASATNRKTWTWSGWIKKSDVLNASFLFSKYTDASNRAYFDIREYSASPAGYVFLFFNRTGGVTTVQLESTQVFRDPSAWYHIVVAVDTTQATASNRVKLFVNGSQVTAFGTATYPSQNADLEWNATGSHEIGGYSGGGAADCYMADVYFIDGQALTPSSFGYFDSNGIWQPNSYTGSYGTNGFWLNFDDNSGTTATTLGKDSSGNGNNWTPNNFSVTAGAGNDSLVDSPTNYGTDTGVGGEVRGNYATFNPLDHYLASFTNGNLNVSLTGGNPTPVAFGTFAVTTGKWYWEMTGDGYPAIGVAKVTGGSPASRSWQNAAGYAYFSNGNKANNNSSSAYGASYTSTDVIGVALDMDAGTLVFYKNGASQGTAFTGLNGSTIQPMFGDWSGSFAGTGVANFGQRPFAYTAPAGFKALCSTNLPTPTIQKGSSYFNPVLYTGTGSTQSITGVGFQPDWVWIKKRSGSESHALSDVLRGTNNILISNSTAGDNTASGTLTAFNSDGFTVGAQGIVNDNTFTFVSWNWKAGGTGVSNTAGSITSTVSANQTAGFSVVTYTGNGTGGATVGHGLGVAPSMMIIKKRNSTEDWAVYHVSIGATKYLNLNTTGGAGTSVQPWNNTDPTSSVFTLGIYGAVNASSSTYVAYCFAPVSGYSAFGSYTGNGSADGPFIYTGFRPRWIMFKLTSGGNGATNWSIFDTSRNPYNLTTQILAGNTSDAEYTTADSQVDILSNGIKIRSTTLITGINQSGATYIYAAFAENPFKIARAR